MAYNSKDLKQDLLKSTKRVLRHADKDFGVTDPAEYTAIGRRLVAEADAVWVQVYGRANELQYIFGHDGLQSYAVVDTSSSFRLITAHPKGWPQAKAHRLDKHWPRVEGI